MVYVSIILIHNIFDRYIVCINIETLCRINFYGLNDLGLPDSKRYLGKVDSQGKASLSILNIQPMDATNYTCEVWTKGNQKLNKFTSILVRRELRELQVEFPSV